jgi:hypothetical protein
MLASGIGFVYAFVAVYFWSVYPNVNKLQDWLLDVLARQGHNVAYKLTIYSHDLAANILLALPFAYLVSLIPPKRSWRLLSTALATSLILVYWQNLVDPDSLVVLSRYWQFWLGIGIQIIALLAAFSIVLLFNRRPIAKA